MAICLSFYQSPKYAQISKIKIFDYQWFSLYFNAKIEQNLDE